MDQENINQVWKLANTKLPNNRAQTAYRLILLLFSTPSLKNPFSKTKELSENRHLLSSAHLHKSSNS